jgi:tetratricopeptide (TPR) repeat protein
MTDPYASCPCGSGKKFKWCCQPIYAGINQALEQAAHGQHEAALRILDGLTKDHADNPEVWGQKARLLYAEGKAEEADEALQKAFDLNANYPFGLLLRATIRYAEGEHPGALLLARRAADAYAPDARDPLAEAYRLIFEVEWRRNRPVAARAALRVVTHYQPAEEEARELFDRLFGPESRLPASARREWSLKSSGKDVGSATGRLSDSAKAFEALTKQAPQDGPAWFNLAISRAWLGDNKGALEAIDRYLDLESNEEAAGEAATLAEVLRCGQGLEEESDYKQQALFYPIRNPEPVNALLNDWSRARRMLVMQAPDEETQAFLALLLELNTASLVTVGAPAADAGRLAGYLAIAGNMMQISSPLKEPFERLRDEVRTRLKVGLGELQERSGPIQFHDVVAEALLFPIGEPDNAEARVREHVQQYYEDRWIHQPRRALSGIAPVDAAGSPKLRKQLRGVVNFIEECAAGTLASHYDFDRLRRKLGLLKAAPATAGTVPADISALSAAELSSLPVQAMSDEHLEQAYQAAHRLDAQELTVHFARALVSRPPNAQRPDRYPWYSFLIGKALKDGELDAALDDVNEGEKADCEHNEGRRRNDYELRRGQVHVKRGEVEQAEDVFRRLIERSPSNFKYRGAAAEAMLALKQAPRALRFAEEGLAEARRANDRDSEQYLMDLVAASKRQGA